MFAVSRPAAGETRTNKDTLTNILDTKVFVVNLVSLNAKQKLTLTSERVDADVDEFELGEVPKLPARKVQVTRVADAQASLECVLHHHCEIGDANVVFGRVVMAHVARGLTKDGYIDTKLLNPIARVSGNGYASVQQIVEKGKS